MRKIVHRLIATGVFDIDYRTPRSETFTGNAVRYKHTHMVQSVRLSLGARLAHPVSVDDGLTAAVNCKHYNLLKLVLEAGDPQIVHS
jgi:hypothetical protein